MKKETTVPAPEQEQDAIQETAQAEPAQQTEEADGVPPADKPRPPKNP